MNYYEIDINNESEIKKVKSFLHSMDLKYEDDIEYTIALSEEGKIIGTGSISGNVLKCIAVNIHKQGEGIAAKIVSKLIQEQFKRGRTKN